MAVPLLSRQHIERELWRRKCVKVKDHAHHSIWKTTKINFHFLVPEDGPDKQCSKYVFENILAEIDRYQGPP